MCQSHDLPYPRSASRIGNPFLQSRWPTAHAWERLLWIPLISWTITDWKKMSGMIDNVHECTWMYDMHLSTDGKNKMNLAGSEHERQDLGKTTQLGFSCFYFKWSWKLETISWASPSASVPSGHPKLSSILRGFSLTVWAYQANLFWIVIGSSCGLGWIGYISVYVI